MWHAVGKAAHEPAGAFGAHLYVGLALPDVNGNAVILQTEIPWTDKKETFAGRTTRAVSEGLQLVAAQQVRHVVALQKYLVGWREDGQQVVTEFVGVAA